MTYTNAQLEAKLGWEGWPDGLEWFANDEAVDPVIDSLVVDALNLYIALDNIKADIFAILDKEDAQ